jgi:hypothetical protein
MEKQGKIKIEIPKEILDLLSEDEKKKIKLIENDESDRKHWLFDGYFGIHLSGKKSRGARLILGRVDNQNYQVLLYFSKDTYSLYRTFLKTYCENRKNLVSPGYHWKCNGQGDEHPDGKEKIDFPQNLNGAFINTQIKF